MSNTEEDEGDLYKLFKQSWTTRSPLQSDAIERAILDDPIAVQRLCALPGSNVLQYPLSIAAFLKARTLARTDVMELIYNAYPDAILHTDSYGRKPLHAALSTFAPLEVIHFLADKSPPDVFAFRVQYNGWTPLHYACCCKSSWDEIKLLVGRYPAALHIKDIYNRTPVRLLPTLRDAVRYDAIFEPLRTLVSTESTTEQMIATMEEFSDMHWRPGVALVLDSRQTLTHSLGIPFCAKPKFFSLLATRCKLSTMYHAIRGGPDLIQDAKVVCQNDHNRKHVS